MFFYYLKREKAVRLEEVTQVSESKPSAITESHALVVKVRRRQKNLRPPQATWKIPTPINAFRSFYIKHQNPQKFQSANEKREEKSSLW